MGTYGRFNTHNSRVKQLKYKKSERYKNIRLAIGESSSRNNSYNKVDRKTLEIIKGNIRKKALKSKRRNNRLTFILIIITLCFTILFTNWVFN
ncbi:MAG: hypothetical protein QNK89_10325 [Lacinutrix sp.]|uniref:hypothetical protein n=1 Tax=Lacinutrix sp. TaxID=1937692 RepID=UPI0030AE1457